MLLFHSFTSGGGFLKLSTPSIRKASLVASPNSFWVHGYNLYFLLKEVNCSKQWAITHTSVFARWGQRFSSKRSSIVYQRCTFNNCTNFFTSHSWHGFLGVDNCEITLLPVVDAHPGGFLGITKKVIDLLPHKPGYKVWNCIGVALYVTCVGHMHVAIFLHYT